MTTLWILWATIVLPWGGSSIIVESQRECTTLKAMQEVRLAGYFAHPPPEVFRCTPMLVPPAIR